MEKIKIRRKNNTYLINSISKYKNKVVGSKSNESTNLHQENSSLNLKNLYKPLTIRNNLLSRYNKSKRQSRRIFWLKAFLFFIFLYGSPYIFKFIESKIFTCILVLIYFVVFFFIVFYLDINSRIKSCIKKQLKERCKQEYDLNAIWEDEKKIEIALKLSEIISQQSRFSKKSIFLPRDPMWLVMIPDSTLSDNCKVITKIQITFNVRLYKIYPDALNSYGWVSQKVRFIDFVNKISNNQS